LIIGNGAAGVTAAEAIRERDPHGQITIVSGERYPMYSRPGLAYVILDEIPDHQILARPPQWYAEQRLRVVYGVAVSVEPESRRVRLADGQSLLYDRLLIATGARAVPPPYSGADLEGVVYLDTLDGTKELLRRVKRARRAVVVGGGITALEMAEGFAHHRVETHYFVRRDTLWASVFNAMESKLLQERMIEHGVTIHFNTEMREVLGDKRRRVKGVRRATGEVFPCNLVGVGIGVKPQLEFVRATALKTDRGLVVNEYLETSEPDIYAAGDCAQVWDRWTQTYTLDVLWPTAIAAGRAAGINMAGGREAYLKGTPFNACLLFGLHVTAIGQLGNRRGDDEPEVVQHLSRGSSEVWVSRPHAYTSAWSHDGPNTLRLVLDGDRLVGALVVGEQTLADPLRDLIEWQADIRPLRPYLQAGGPEMARMIHLFWRRLKTSNGATRPLAETPPAPVVQTH
jgi:NAD(P)H-nitrite reductase large subunit